MSENQEEDVLPLVDDAHHIKPPSSEPNRESADAAVLAESHRHTRRSFLLAGGAAAAVGSFYAYLNLGPENETQPGPLRDAFLFNADGSRELFREHALAPTYPLNRSETLRVNGMFGIKKELVPESWRLQLVGVKNDAADPRYVSDVTAWDYRYTEAKDKEDPGHDTKVDPAKQKNAADGQNRPSAQRPPAAGREDPGNGQGSNNDQSDKSDTSKKMTPGKMQGPADADSSKQNADTGQDDNHLGRKPRGMEEAGESNSTLRAGTAGLLLQMQDMSGFPRHELVTQFKCIEGWSQIVHWGGIRMKDFLDAYPPELIDGKEPRYVYMETPDGDYYVGYDLKVLRHPQTLLVTEMMGLPLTQFHGAPLRLHTPLKYGYKQIKRIGLIAYTNDKPDDYWTKLGYDWYAGL